MSNTVKNWAIASLMITLAICVVLLARDAHYALLSLDGALAKIDGTAAELQRTSKLVTDYVQKQKAVLESPRNQKALEAGWQMAAVLNGTARDINRLVVPRAMNTMDGLNAAIGSFDQSAQALTALVRNTDRSINESVLPNLAETARTLGVSMEAVTASVRTMATKGALSIDEINALLADPHWLQILTNVAATSAHADTVAGHFEEASRLMPAIAASLDKIAATSSKYQKLLLLAQLLATIARAF
ncbi:MAG: hypothetical protein LAP85_14925 [Acidobacteriia bacterium]|nr:hypothetical protein [Terriglobia bacterium]